MAMIVFMNQNYYVTKFRLWAKKEQKKLKLFHVSWDMVYWTKG